MSLNITLMRKQLLVCLQLEKFLPFLKTNKRFYCCRSIPLLFDVYCICREAYFNDDIKSDDGCFTGNSSGSSEWYHRRCIKLKIFEMKSTICSGNALFAESKLYELCNLYNENKGFIYRGLCVEKYNIFKNLVAEIFF